MGEGDIALERAYLAKVLAYLRQAIKRAQNSADAAGSDVQRERDLMWQDGPRIVRDIDDAVELLAYNRVVDMERRSLVIRQGELNSLLSMRSTPYFARIDFYDEAYAELIEAYIGRRALADEKTLEFYVYDWRSPIASMFYDFDRGPAYYESPAGRVEGDLRLKRQFTIYGGELRGMVDANAIVRDEILGEILSRGAGHSLKVIAESIQREQNQAIRFLAPRDMLVMGPAGSGKTSVGLHHVAYLLYHNRGRLSSRDIVAVSANHAFNDYIAGVLPELYEADIRREVFPDIIAAHIPRKYRVESFYDQAEYLLSTQEEDARARYIAKLYSTRFLKHIKGRLDGVPMRAETVKAGGEVVAGRREIERHMDEGGPYDYRTRLMRADHYIRARLEDYFACNRVSIRESVEARVNAGELDLYTGAEIEGHIDGMLDRAVRRGQRAIREKSGLSAEARLLDIVRSYAQLTGGGEGWHDGLRDRLRACSLRYEDMLALLCVREHMGLLAAQTDARHVLVDEAQDYGVLQHHLLRALFPRAVFTLLADTGQTVLPAIGIADGTLFDELCPGALERFTLQKSYRSTGPIGALCASLAARGGAMTWFDREGPMPELRRVDDIARGVAELLGSAPREGSTAVIAGTRAQAEALFARVGKEISARLITEESDAVDSDLVILPLYLAKGLEFDRVIVALDGDGAGIADRRNMMYLYCTRALHELVILHTGAVPAALRQHMELLDVRE